MQETPLFLGLTRPPKIFGLPIGYFIGLLLLSVIPFVGLDDWRFLLVAVFGYPVLWLIADRNPNFFEVLSVVFAATPRTSRRSAEGGDRYVN